MAWFLGQSLLIIIAAILLGVLVGWLIWGRPAKPAPSEPLPAEPQATPAEPEPATLTEPVARAAAEPDDDLERIEGIGPKMAGALRQAGLRSFRQLADADEAKLRKAIEDAGLNFAPSLATWSRQARLLADRDEEGFADLVRRLVAGRDVGRS